MSSEVKTPTPKLDAVYTKDAPDAKHYKLLIDGEWVDSSTGEEIAVYSPIDGELLGYYPKASKEDVDRAVAAARRAAAEWRLRPPFERAAIVHQMAEALDRHREDLALLKSRENGKPYAGEAIPCAEESAENFRIAAEDIKRLESPVIPSRDGNKRI